MKQLVGLVLCVATSVALVGCNKPKSQGQDYVGGASLTPPHYLEVKGFKSCLRSKSMGSWDAWCLPARKPANCSHASWHELFLEGQSGSLEHC